MLDLLIHHKKNIGVCAQIKDMKKAEKKPRTDKKSRRDQVKNAALKKKYNSRILGEHVDYDYLDQLNEKDLAWLNKFTKEFHKASYKHDGTDIQDYNEVIGQDEEGKDITYGKDSNDRNNA